MKVQKLSQKRVISMILTAVMLLTAIPAVTITAGANVALMEEQSELISVIGVLPEKRLDGRATDYYKIEIQNPGTLHLDLFGLPYIIEIFNSSGASVFKSPELQTNPDYIRAAVPLNSRGVYYISVYNSSASSGMLGRSNYQLVTGFTSTHNPPYDVIGADTEFVNKSFEELSASIPPVGNVNGSIGTRGKVLHEVILPTAGTFVINGTNIPNMRFMTFYNSNGEVIFKQQGSFPNNLIDRAMKLNAGTYYISVKSSLYLDGGVYSFSTNFCSCGVCDICRPYVTGDVNGDKRIDITDALEILKYLAGLPSAITDGNVNITAENALNAARIITPGQGVPAIGDVLEILKHLAGLPNKIDG
jgi:hypothetical protein